MKNFSLSFYRHSSTRTESYSAAVYTDRFTQQPQRCSWRFLLIAFLYFYCFSHVALSDTNSYNPADYDNILRPIRIGLSIDDRSFKDLAILMNSIIEAALEPRDVVFHIAAVGADMRGSKMLQHSIEATIKNCFSTTRVEVVAFMLPEGSGFSKQLQRLKQKSHHWNSASGADMVRFFLPQIFPHAERILYVDNDVVVSCCLEGIWSTALEEQQIVGIALDSLNWATVTQFRRHYNASHPLVIKNMRRNQPLQQQTEKEQQPIEEKEFSAALPRYPNDGVLLIDVQKYNAHNILQLMDEVAMANAMGDYAVNLGTQQFTVLALFDRWKELTPRANLRHSPDMARGYLMWFYYNGFIHYAGQAKPRSLCHSTPDAESAKQRLPYMRAMSYAAWALSNYVVAQKCPLDHFAYAADCVKHVKTTESLPQLLSLLQQVLAVSRESALLYLRIGPLHGDLSKQAHQQRMQQAASAEWSSFSATSQSAIHTAVVGNSTINSHSNSSGSGVLSNESQWLSATSYFKLAALGAHSGDDFIAVLDRVVLHDGSYSVRVFDHKTQRIEYSRSSLRTATGLAADDINPTRSAAVAIAEEGKKKGRKGPTPRTFRVHMKHLCDSILPRYAFLAAAATDADNISNSSIAATATATATESDADAVVAPPPCTDLLQEIKAEGKKHWDVQMIVIDVNPPHSGVLSNSSFASSSNSGESGSPVASPMLTTTTIAAAASVGGRPSKQHSKDKAFSRSSTFSNKHTSLGVLLNLDLVFMRPKFIIVRVASSSEERLQHDIATAEVHLRKQGYLASHHRGSQCGDSWTAAHGGKSTLIQYACVWGSRVTEFELYEGLL